jgi:Fe-S oxidoreductase
VQSTRALLEKVNVRVNLIEAGCCGMAGAFGYEVEHYEISMMIGEYSLFPIIRTMNDKSGGKVTITAPGISCRSHIKDGTGCEAIHPIELVKRQLSINE